MPSVVRAWIIALAVALALGGCAPATAPIGSTAPQPAEAARKRVIAVVLGDVYTVSSFLADGTAGQNNPGIAEIEKLLNEGLTVLSGPTRVARLAERVPTTENGLWHVLPDGTMEMTWRLRSNAMWHDGTPVTAEDFLFSAQLATDNDLAVARNPIYRHVESVTAPDAQTVVAKWRSPYIEADQLFGGGNSLPLPRHLLEEPYRASKDAFLQLPFWNAGYVGTGAFRLRTFEPSSHLIVEVNDQYVLGRPKLQEIEVRFIPDAQTAVANLMSGASEIIMGRGFSLEQGLTTRDQWREGKIDIEFSEGGPMLGPQFINPNPAIIADLRFRRALLQAINRQELADTLQGGLVGVKHSLLPANDPTYAEAENRAVRYEYDPRRATQTIEELGYTRGLEGFVRDANGRTLAVPMVSSPTQLYVRIGLVVADMWKQIGIEGRPTEIPAAQRSDLQLRTTFPGFEIVNQGSGISSVPTITAAETPLPENNYRGRNRSRYVNADLENLITRYTVTIPMRERVEILGDIVHHLTDNVVYLHLFHGGAAMAIGNRLVNVNAAQNTSNGYEWDVR
jgi:peptide/nickel transport system substrate-binding protein